MNNGTNYLKWILNLLFIFLCFNESVKDVEGYGYRYFQDRIVDTECAILLGQTNKLYNDTVTLAMSKLFVFHIDRKYIQRSHTTNLRAEVAADTSASLRSPLLFVVRQERQISSMEVPYTFPEESKNLNRSIFYYAGRTLCIDEEDDDDLNGRNITIRVTTQSDEPVRFYLMLRLTEDFQLPMGKEVTFDVLPTAPVFYGFAFHKPDTELVKIRVTSPTETCMTVSIQKIECPIHDLEDNVRYKGLWQTMSTTAAMTVQKTLKWYNEGFILVFVSHIDKDICGRRDSFAEGAVNGVNTVGGTLYDLNRSPMSAANRRDPFSFSKTVTVKITDESQVSGWILALCLLLPIAVTFLIAFGVLLLFRNRHIWMCKILTQKFGTARLLSPLLQEREQDGADRDSNASTEEAETAPASPAQQERHSVDHTNSQIQSISEMNTKPDGAKDASRIKWKADLYISDFTGRGFNEVMQFSKRFYWTIGIVATFYSIPVYQLVLHYLRVLYRTGEYDICYYNYLCAQRLGILIDFNHFWSNASYVIFGVLYILIVRRRSRNLCIQKEECKNGIDCGNNEEEEEEGFSCCCCFQSGEKSGDDTDGSHGKVGQAKGLLSPSSTCFCVFSSTCFRWDHGVPQHFGVFYALGVALTMEGFLSAAYHLCPNQSTFQFDTAFMYVIAVLLLLKIYQFRHPVHFGANHTFAILAGFVAISVVGLIFERGSKRDILIFKCIFYVIQFIVLIGLSVYYYAVGYVKNGRNHRLTTWGIYRHLGELKSGKINADRLIQPFISFTICIAVLIYTEVGDIGFATYLLYLLVGNVLGSTLYYVGIMKPLHGEFKNRTWVQPTLYFLAAGIIGGLSLYYFLRSPAQWQLSASASRAVNEECLNVWFPFHPFYDSHDAWHFLSAAALFLAFMGLLIVDDDLITTPQTKIPVF